MCAHVCARIPQCLGQHSCLRVGLRTVSMKTCKQMSPKVSSQALSSDGSDSNLRSSLRLESNLTPCWALGENSLPATPLSLRGLDALKFSVHGVPRQEERASRHWRGCHSVLQGIFLTQGSNRFSPKAGRFFYCLSHQGSRQFKLRSIKKRKKHYFASQAMRT